MNRKPSEKSGGFLIYKLADFIIFYEKVHKQLLTCLLVMV